MNKKFIASLMLALSFYILGLGLVSNSEVENKVAAGYIVKPNVEALPPWVDW